MQCLFCHSYYAIMVLENDKHNHQIDTELVFLYLSKEKLFYLYHKYHLNHQTILPVPITPIHITTFLRIPKQSYIDYLNWSLTAGIFKYSKAVFLQRETLSLSPHYSEGNNIHTEPSIAKVSMPDHFTETIDHHKAKKTR